MKAREDGEYDHRDARCPCRNVPKTEYRCHEGDHQEQ